MKEEVIKKTIQILDSIDYERYSERKAKGYLEYMKGFWSDELTLISSILLPKFAADVLGFTLEKTLWPQKSEVASSKRPDFTPTDTKTHPFVFETKGTDCQDLSTHYLQIKGYIQRNNFIYGIVTNMRDLNVYTEDKSKEIEDYNFSFLTLYRDYKEEQTSIFEKENTKRFIRFVEGFSFKELTSEDKVKLIASSKPWTGLEDLNEELLTNQLRKIVNALYEDAKGKREELLNLSQSDPERTETMTKEIRCIGFEISPSSLIPEETFSQILKTKAGTLLEKALNSFFYRVAYFAMTRILLARTWEDIGFIDQSLYNGGFDKWYKNFDQQIQRVLRYAFGLAAEKYHWLFNVDNNYSWFEPSHQSLIDVLYELSNFNLSRLNQDVLGAIYEEYIERVDKKNKGQYYTPREIVNLIWDRVGYNRPEAFFYHKEGRRQGRLIFDPATGSGGFLVEAARRIREESGVNFNDFSNLFETYRAILYGLFGTEISIFPYYITEVNLLIQLTPLLKQTIRLKKGLKENTPLGVVCCDALSLHQPHTLFEEGETPKMDDLHNILSLDRQKMVVAKKIKKDLLGKFSYCCANPPYIGEKGHKELFRDTIRRFPYWKNYYQGKMDYLYFFIILGLEKLHEWGYLGFITTSYWPTADGASNLRRYILENALIKEMIFFENIKIFEHAKGQHSMVFILRKLSSQAKLKDEAPEDTRAKNHIKIVKVKCKNADLPGKTIRENLRFLTEHISKHITEATYEDKYIKVFWSGVTQGELPHNGGAWNEILIPKDKRILLSKLESCSVPLKTVFDLYQGVVPGADRVSKQNIKHLPQEKISNHNIKMSDGIFVISGEEAESISISKKDKELLIPSYRNSHICPYFVDIPSEEEDFLIYIDEQIDLNKYPGIKEHLSKFKEILETRLERYEESYSWYRLCRPRDGEIFSKERIVVSNWGEGWQPFALQNKGYIEKRDITLFIKKSEVQESLLYFLGLLNSQLIQRWMQHKAKQVGYMRQSLQKQIPIYRINFDDPEEVKLHNEIVEKVESICKKMAELAKYSKYFRKTRLTRLGFDQPLPEVNKEVIVRSLETLYSIRTHPGIKIEKSKEFNEEMFCLDRIGEAEKTLFEEIGLRLVAKDKSFLTLKAEEGLLQLVAYLLEGWKERSWTEIKEKLLIPDAATIFESKKKGLISVVESHRTQIKRTQEEIDQITNKLYRI
ncbi:N-6 DNA methylase [bacterium]|nr:N-6 DNA methylase [bacterium]